VDFARWEPIYDEVLADFGFDRTRDERSARFLQALLAKRGALEPSHFERLLRGRDVLVCGKAPSLARELAETDVSRYVVVVADGATSTLLRSGVVPDVVVTDLDGDVVDLLDANRRGASMVVHAHGDNVDLIVRVAPQLERVLGTTQAAPTANVHNFGGFTDGDRAVFFALHFRPRSLTLIGFDYDDPNVTPTKAKKLKWARRLVALALEEAGMQASTPMPRPATGKRDDGGSCRVKARRRRG